METKATCPFIGSAVNTGKLPVRNDVTQPLASINDVVRMGNSGGGDLGQVLKIFAQGNHALAPGKSGKLDQRIPAGLFSLDFSGSQGSHPGHSGILQGDPSTLGSGRMSSADFERLTRRAKDGQISRSEIAKFIAENLHRDPSSKVFGAKVVKLLAGDLNQFVHHLGPALLQKLGRHPRGAEAAPEERLHFEALTKLLGEDNLIGSCGEFGLLLAFLENKPGARVIDGEPAVSVEDLKLMFEKKQLPVGWERWPKTKASWVHNSTALTIAAGKEYLRTR